MTQLEFHANQNGAVAGDESNQMAPLRGCLAKTFSFSKYGCYVMAWMQSHGNFSHPEGKVDVFSLMVH